MNQEDGPAKTIAFPREGVAGLVTQVQIVEVLLLDAQVKQLSREIRAAREERDEKKAVIIEALIGGAEVEPGPHIAEVKRMLRLDLI